jgi:hypothetical protein
MTHACRDLVPANAAANHLQSGDTFTCTGSQFALPDVQVAAGQTLLIDNAANLYINTISAGTKIVNVRSGTAYTGSSIKRVVAHVRSLTVADGGAITEVGMNGTAVILLVDTNVTLGSNNTTRTVVDLSSSANGECPASDAPSASGFGSGGGGNGTNGGADGQGHAGGPALGVATNEALAPGGSGAGAPNGGNGGGALQISACGSITVGSMVVVNASGLGGMDVDLCREAGGAGAGGTLLLEAANVAIDPGAVLVANGGGGSAGASISGGAATGSTWTVGQSPTQVAMGGPSDGLGGAGGNGGAGTSGATAGAPAPSGGMGAPGGGGGAVGAIFVNVAPSQPTPGTGMTSPPPHTSKVCVTSNGVAPPACTYP